MGRNRPRLARGTRLFGIGLVLAVLGGPLTACGPVTLAASLPAEQMTLTPGRGSVQPDPTAPDHRALKIWANGTASGTVTVPASVQVDIQARGDQCQGAPAFALRIDGVTIGAATVSNTTWRTFSFSRALNAGKHRIDVAFTNDHAVGWCDRNLWLDWVHVDKAGAAPTPAPKPTPPPPPPTAADSNPFTGRTLFVDPQSQAAVDAATLVASDPPDAALLNKIAGQPQADWFGDWVPTGSLAAAVNTRVTQVTAAGALPVLVAYAIPNRDCNGFSAGGVATPAAYHDWITQFAAGISGRRAVVILEPDALAGLDCLTASQQTDRISSLKDALAVLTVSPNTAVYLDAGHSGWQTVSVMAARLSSVGLQHARGFSLNVSGFDDTAAELAYGQALASATGKHYVIDTSRNGLGNGDTSCNPAGRALGSRPTSETGTSGADAYLWIKHPGESDGACGEGDPAAGAWFRSYAEGLASRAAW